MSLSDRIVMVIFIGLSTFQTYWIDQLSHRIAKLEFQTAALEANP